MITGVRPTGTITLANYIGGIKKFVEQQKNFKSIIFIADIHGLTTYIEPDEIRNNIMDITALYLAYGIDLKHTIIFQQSDVLEHCYLGYLMAFQCGVGELSRMTKYKSKRKVLKREEKDMGLFIYPTLMAADILLYDASVVPVGADQRQHIEKTRDLGERFNKVYGHTFQLPEYQIPTIGAKIMNLQNPEIKMSKSAPKNDKGTIFILDDIETTRKKIMSSVTDGENKIAFDEVNKPGISNLISIIAVIEGLSIEEVLLKYENYTYREFKEAVADKVCAFIISIQEKFYMFRSNEDYLKKVLKAGAKKARILASKKLQEVNHIVGLQ